jgi:hypothetical protein
MSDACRSCKAPIIWLEHVRTGKRAPIDAAPTPEGNIVVSLPSGTYRIAETPDLVEREPLHTNHDDTHPACAVWQAAMAGRP